jgi:ketosteroid isomerase-like protein
MTTTAEQTATPPIPHFAVAGTFLEALAARDLTRLAATLTADAELHAMVPRGPLQFTGPEQISAALHRWFVEVDEFELLDADIGEVGPRLYLRWRVRVSSAERFGPGTFLVEQQVYADTDDSGRIIRISLLCSGYCREHAA